MKRQRTPEPPSTAEEWRDIPIFPGYQVSDWGNIRSLDRYISRSQGRPYLKKGQRLKPYPNQDGYLIITLSVAGVTWRRTVHTLVAQAFLGDPPSNDAQVHHRNRHRQDNRLCNLVYKPGPQHLSDHFSGEDNPAAKLTEPQIEQIKRLIAQGQSQRQIARKFAVNQSTVSRLNSGVNWKHLFVPATHRGQLDLFLDFEITDLQEMEY